MEILLLGTIHLEETTDMVQLSEESKAKLNNEQFEILTNDLAAFKPNQIFVEYPFHMQQQLDAIYQQDLETNALHHNEIAQIGMRLAKKLKHEQIYAVDWNEEIPGLAGLEALSEGVSSPEFHQIMTQARAQMEASSATLQNGKIIELFKFINTYEQIRIDHKLYTDLMLLNDENAFDWVANYWYYRNLKIVKNIRLVTKQSSKRAVVLYGAGHNYLLQQMLEDIPNVTVIPYGEYASKMI